MSHKRGNLNSLTEDYFKKKSFCLLIMFPTFTQIIAFNFFKQNYNIGIIATFYR